MIGLSPKVSGGGIYIVGVVTSSVRGSSPVVLDIVADLLSGVKAADEVTAPVHESMSVRIWSHNDIMRTWGRCMSGVSVYKPSSL